MTPAPALGNEETDVGAVASQVRRQHRQQLQDPNNPLKNALGKINELEAMVAARDSNIEALQDSSKQQHQNQQQEQQQQDSNPPKVAGPLFPRGDDGRTYDDGSDVKGVNEASGPLFNDSDEEGPSLGGLLKCIFLNAFRKHVAANTK